MIKVMYMYMKKKYLVGPDKLYKRSLDSNVHVHVATGYAHVHVIYNMCAAYKGSVKTGPGVLGTPGGIWPGD